MFNKKLKIDSKSRIYDKVYEEELKQEELLIINGGKLFIIIYILINLGGIINVVKNYMNEFKERDMVSLFKNNSGYLVCEKNTYDVSNLNTLNAGLCLLDFSVSYDINNDLVYQKDAIDHNCSYQSTVNSNQNENNKIY